MTAVAIVYHSASGRTRMLAEAVARGAGSVEGTVTHVLSVDEAARAQALLATADAIVFGSPTYMGSASAQFKAFMDGTSTVWALQGWRDKLAAGFTHSAALSGDKLGTLTQLAVFAAQHGMVWVGLGLPPTYAAADTPDEDTNRLGSHLGAMAQSRPGGGVVPTGDVKTAELLGKRVAAAAARWALAGASAGADPDRHPAARNWVLPPKERVDLGGGIERTNLRTLVARPERYEHHLMVCATVDGAQLEITTASEPLYFSHINLSDEYAIALPTGDELVDRFPLRTFLSDPRTGEDVGRYNHRVGDLVLHPEGLLHWPGRLRAPYEPFDFPPGMRRCGLSLVYCASEPTPATPPPPGRPAASEEDAKAYVTPPPPMALASTRGQPGVVARVGRTNLTLVEVPKELSLPHGGWVVVLEAERSSPYAACDLLRIPEEATLNTAGIVRALVLSSERKAPDETPAAWREVPEAAFAPFEAEAPGALPLELSAMRVAELSPSFVSIAIGDASTEVPRYWLSRMLHRVAMHKLRLGYAETYGGFFVDDREDDVRVGLRGAAGQEPASVTLPRAEAMAAIERLYRAVAPAGYRERPI